MARRPADFEPQALLSLAVHFLAFTMTYSLLIASRVLPRRAEYCLVSPDSAPIFREAFQLVVAGFASSGRGQISLMPSGESEREPLDDHPAWKGRFRASEGFEDGAPDHKRSTPAPCNPTSACSGRCQ